MAAVVILLLVDRNLLCAQAAAGLLFPVAVWLSVVGWRAMMTAVASRSGPPRDRVR